SRRGGRSITIDGRGFRWKLNAESPDTLALLVEPEDGGAMLEVQLPDEMSYGSITPRLVEQVVRRRWRRAGIRTGRSGANSGGGNPGNCGGSGEMRACGRKGGGRRVVMPARAGGNG